MRGGAADFSVREQLPRQALAQYQEFYGFAEGNLAVIESDLLFSPGHIDLGLDGVKRNFLRKLLEAFLVEFDSVHVVTDEEFVQLFRRRAFHDIQELKDRKVRFLPGSCKFRLKCEAGLSPRDNRSCVIFVEPRTSALMMTCDMTLSCSGLASSGSTHSYKRLFIRESSRAFSVVTRLMRSMQVVR